ncbi:transglutaminase domain-containing protein [Emticicia sp. TH156]|uniref:transglutaminase domain-containing protein n=1 Tax=Emticicia sp. TH156 TaxID=2067454 RepID=UPI00130423D2|nr:transglutaminase domain-containing protein [Emticicia sp. TH156]
MKKLLLLLVTSCANLVYAQKNTEPVVKFGEISRAEVEMKVYPADSTADAVFLYDHGTTTFDLRNNMIQTRFTYHGRIKILKKSALDLGTIAKQIYKDGADKSEYINDIKGYTYNLENGEIKRDKLTKESIFSEKPVGNVQDVKIVMPNVKVGSVIEYSFNIETPFSISNNPKPWSFQGLYPALWSIYEITIPSFFHYRILMSGYLDLTDNQTKSVNVSFGTQTENGLFQRFIMKDVPAFRNEAFITTSSDYVTKMDFELASVNWPGYLIKDFSLDYPSLNNTMLGASILGGQLKHTGFLSGVAKDISKTYADSSSRIKAACEYIQKNIKWNRMEGLYSNSIRKVLDSRTGDAGDINLLLIALLRELGFDANPVILSTRSHGKIHEQFALRKRFNYVVAHIERNGKDLLLDATDEYQKPGMLPVQCLNGKGWLVHPEKPRFVSLAPSDKELKFKKADLSLSEDGELQGLITRSYGGYGDLTAKKDFNRLGADSYLDEVKKKQESWIIEKADFANTTAVNESFEAKYQVTLNNYATKAGKMLHFKPMLSEGFEENPLKTKDRVYPIDMAYPKEEIFIGNFEIPEGYSVAELPKNTVISLPGNGGRFMYSVAVNGKSMMVSSRVQFLKPVYYAEEYPILQEFYDKIVAKHNELITLKKN